MRKVRRPVEAGGGPPVAPTGPLVAAAVGAAVTCAAVDLLVSPAAAATLVTGLQAAAASAFTLLSLRHGRTEPGRGWTGLAVLGATWALSRLLTLLQGPGLGSLVVGSWAESAVWMVGVPFGLFGLYRQCFGDLPSSTRRRLLSDALFMAMALTMVGWTVYHHATFGEQEPAPDWHLLLPLVLLLAAALLVNAGIVQPGQRRTWWLAAAVVADLVAMTAVFHQRDTGLALGGPVVVAALAATPVLTLGFVLLPVGPALPATFVPFRGPRILVIYLPAVLALAATLWEVRQHGSLTGTTALLGVLLAATFVVNHRLLMADAASQLDRAERSERRFRVTFDNAPVGLVAADRDAVILQANAAAGELVEEDPEDLVGRHAEDFYAPAGRTDRADARAELRSGLVGRFSHEAQLSPPGGGEARHVRVTVNRVDGDPEVHSIAVAEDVTERRRAQDRLRYLADHDALTGLWNRRGLVRNTEEALGAATADGPAAFLLVDLDQFKLVNDSYGHTAGDRLLVACAERLAAVVGNRGAVARFGGDEFCVVLFPSPGADHRAVADDVRERIQGAVALPGGDAYPTLSVGAVLSRPGATGEELLCEADEALYLAKERGRNRVEWYGRTELARSRYDQRILADLHRALRGRQLAVHHQPVVEVASGALVGTEALVRWYHPVLGTLGPDTFLPVAERSGLMTVLGRQVLVEACAAAVRWPPAGPDDRALTVSVNVAPQQLLEPGFVLEVARILRDTHLDPDRLWLEITESTLMQDVSVTQRVLEDVRALGVHLAIDDFGTGYSSLTYLKRFPVEAIKMDKSFVDGVGLDSDDTTIVSALVGLGRQLGLQVVAEGVEGPEQLRILRQLRCHLAQGYHLGRPVPADEFEAGLAVAAPGRT